MNDTGKSIQTALDHIKEFGASNVKVAVMHEKKGSLLTADFFVEYLDSWRWLIYEWAIVEDVGSFISKSNCKSLSECLSMLKKDYDLQLDRDHLKSLLPFINSDISLE